jgi:hypothetical protein
VIIEQTPVETERLTDLSHGILRPQRLKDVSLLNRGKIKEILENLNERASSQSKKETDGLSETLPSLPRAKGRWLKRRLAYLPLALEIAKASNRKNMKKVQNLTAPLPGNVKRKVRRILERRPSRQGFLHKFRRRAG